MNYDVMFMRNAGIIEGFYGTPWEREMRLSYASFMSECGLSFYIYAPKNDPFLRRRWQDEWTEDYVCYLLDLAQAFHRRGIRFGIGFTPHGDASEVLASGSLLSRRIREIASLLPLDIFALLFDDLTNNDRDKLASFQLAVTDLFLEASSSVPCHVVCPSYYSFDPVLEKVFGAMPAGYWKEYAEGLDPAVDVFWTGNRVCSPGYTREDLERAADVLGRKPFLWDNYPVNDGRKMADFLYLRPFSDRGPELDQLTSGHGINPMREPLVNRLVLATLPWAYDGTPLTEASSEYRRLAEKLLGRETADLVLRDFELFAHRGLGSMAPEQAESLAAEYQELGTAAGQEIATYLRGGYRFDPACLTG